MELNVSELRLGDLGYGHMPYRINFRIEKGYIKSISRWVISVAYVKIGVYIYLTSVNACKAPQKIIY